MRRRLGTRRLLRAQLTALLVLTALTATLLFDAYGDLHRRPAEVRDRIAPAVLEVAAARTALMTAHLAARETLEEGLSDVVGPGEEYRTQIASATQSLSQIADRQVGSEDAELGPATISALLVAYSEAVERAGSFAGTRVLREAWFRSADAILNRDNTGILHRLDALQQLQLAELTEETSFTGAHERLWWWAAAALLSLVALLAVVQGQLNRRFPQRLNPYLLGAALILLASWFAVPAARHTQDRLDAAHAELAGVIGDLHGTTTDDELELDVLRTRTSEVAERVTDDMNETGTRAGAITAIPVGGGAVALLCWLGIGRHAVRYRHRP
ncbi:hypothetical protein [Streptomyces litchfieldiae]|uniref:Integral membrane protein n=1 Tax=Streptomyces litchfieldiae TaxID=3075543 RepID=A0ABU2MIY3_9ACTN|nr:hypothetical protein [Streptomyces sp. DSM 44938]MDT0341539.1 hypothetical protein [Streptomyces sp. DSM 44938]